MGTSATELERLVVRLVGEGSDYEKVINEAVAQTEQAARKITALTQTEMASQNAAMEEAARITEAVATPTERYAAELSDLERLYKSGALSQQSYSRAVKQMTTQLPSVQKAQAKHNESLAAAKRITQAARTPLEHYQRKLKELTGVYNKGLISTKTYTRSLQMLNKEYKKGGFAVQAFGQKMKSTGRQMRGTGMMMSMAVTMPVAGMIASYSSFDKAMTNSLSIMGRVSAGIRDEMENTARVLARSGVTSARALAKSYFFLASAGMSAEQAIAALPIVEKFATAGAFDMATATDLLTDAQSALGLSCKDVIKNMENLGAVGDILVKANTIANASVQQFSEALTNDAGAAIKQYNMDLEEGVAILAVYADQGKKGAVAGSMLGRMTRLLVKGIKDNGAAFRRMGIETDQFANTGKNVTGVIEGISRAVDGLGPVQKAAALEALGFQARIQQTILPLLGMTDQIAAYQKSLENAAGITEEVANKQLAGFGAQLKMIWHQFTEIGDEIGKHLAPVLLLLGNVLSSLMTWWRGLSSGMREFVAIVVGIVAAIGPLLIIFGTLTVAAGTVTAAFGFLQIAGWAALAPVALLAAKLALFAGFAIGVYAVADALAGVEGGVKGIGDELGLLTADFDYELEIWKEGFLSFWDTLVLGWDSLWISVMLGAQEFWIGLKGGFKMAWTAVWNTIKLVGKGIASAFESILNGIIFGINKLVGAAQLLGFEVEKLQKVDFGIDMADPFAETKDAVTEMQEEYEAVAAAATKAREASVKGVTDAADKRARNRRKLRGDKKGKNNVDKKSLVDEKALAEIAKMTKAANDLASEMEGGIIVDIGPNDVIDADSLLRDLDLSIPEDIEKNTPQGQKTQFVGAALRGSKEDYSARLAHKTKGSKFIENTEKNTREAADTLVLIKDILEDTSEGPTFGTVGV